MLVAEVYLSSQENVGDMLCQEGVAMRRSQMERCRTPDGHSASSDNEQPYYAPVSSVDLPQRQVSTHSPVNEDIDRLKNLLFLLCILCKYYYLTFTFTFILRVATHLKNQKIRELIWSGKVREFCWWSGKFGSLQMKRRFLSTFQGKVATR